jgi:hypothetical protein
MKGSSPPPKVKRGQSEPSPYGVHRDSKGKEVAPGWGSPPRASPSPPREPRKDRKGFKPIKKTSSGCNPEGSIKSKRPFNRPREKGPSTRAVTPDSSSECEKNVSSVLEAPVGKFSGELDKYLTRGRGAGYREIMDAEKKVKTLGKTNYRQLSEEWSNLSPRHKVGEIIWFYTTEEKVGKWKKACVERVVLPTEVQYREGMTSITHQICRLPMRGNESEITIQKEGDLTQQVG